MNNIKDNHPYFSLIIPCLNEQKVLPLLLSDINKQIFSDFEIIVVDGKSEDKIKAIALKNPKTTLIISDKRNVSHQRNLGAKNANGKYLVFFDADTRINDYFLSGLAYRVQMCKPDMFSCWAKIEETQSDNQILANLINMSLEIYKFVDSPSAIGAMMGFRKSVFDSLKGFTCEITFGEDSELVKRGFKKGYQYIIFKDPRYYYSLRRFKTEGTLKMLQKYAKLNSSVLLKGYPTNDLNDEYPMRGGLNYLGKNHKSRFIDQIERSIAKLKNVTELKKWMQYWQRLINE